jgi:hypothetical protein
MKNEIEPKQRQSATAQKSKAGATAQADSRIQRKPQQAGRREGCAKKQTPLRTCGAAADGFLKHRFLPLYEPARDLTKNEGIEKGVLNSLSILSGQYGLNLLNVTDKPYPYNILLAYWDADQQISRQNEDLELYIISDGRDEVKMATKQTASRSYSLYYIPVLPLYRLVKSGESRQGAELLLSVFSYLYHVADVPYYRDAESYLFYHYEILADWIENDIDDVDEGDLNFNRSALCSAQHYGDIIMRKIHNACHLDRFARRIEEAQPRNPFDEACLHVAKTAFALWADFPQGNIHSHLHEGLNGGNEEDGDEYDHDYPNTIYVGEYIHFIAESEGSLYDSIQQNIDAELNEKMYWQEHCLVSLYDENYSPLQDSLEFENRFFILLDELSYLLTKLP